MRRITSFKPQHRPAAARPPTPPPPPYEPLSPVLGPAAALAADPAAAHRAHRAHHAHRAHAAPHRTLPNGAPRPPPQPLDAAAAAVEHPRRASYAAPSPRTLPPPLADRAPKHAYPRDAPYTLDERPAKRARSEFYSASSPTYGHQHSRPATSHNPGWSYNVEHMADMGLRMYHDNPAAAPKQEHNPDKRLSDAQLLLDFFQVSAHTAHTPPSTAKRLSISQVAPAYPAQFPPHHSPHFHQHPPRPASPRPAAAHQPLHHAHPPRAPDVAHVPEPPSLPTDVTLPAPAIQTRTPPEDHSATHPPPPMSTTSSTEDAKPKKHQGWPKGKPRGPRNTPSSTKRKKATPKPRAPASTTSKATADHVHLPQSNGLPAATRASTSSSSSATPPHYDQPAAARRHSFSNSFLVLPTADLPSEAVRAQSVPLQAFLDTARPPPTEPGRRTKAHHAEPDLICASCKSSNSVVKVGDGEQWIGCDGCKEWYHYACAGFNSEREVRDVNKFYCEPCRPRFGQTTSRSTDAHCSNKSDLAQRFASRSEPTPPLTTPA